MQQHNKYYKNKTIRKQKESRVGKKRNKKKKNYFVLTTLNIH